MVYHKSKGVIFEADKWVQCPLVEYFSLVPFDAAERKESSLFIEQSNFKDIERGAR